MIGFFHRDRDVTWDRRVLYLTPTTKLLNCFKIHRLPNVLLGRHHPVLSLSRATASIEVGGGGRTFIDEYVISPVGMRNR